MTRISLLVCIFLLISIEASGQCVNSPTVTLSSNTGGICSLTPVTLSGNTFGGSAKKVTITENGTGSVSPSSTSKSPFTFTYTPKNGDNGKTVIITVTTDNPLGLPCAAAKATYTLTVDANPSAPVVGTIIKPTCEVSTGSVVLNSLPSTGTWTLTRNPGAITTTGTGTSVTISSLASGTYSFTVSSSGGCTSKASANVVIPAQPVSPGGPVQTVDCALGSGKAVVKVTSPTGTGLNYSLDGGLFQSGTSFSGVGDGSHIITVKNSSGCTTTGTSFNVSCGCVNPPALTLSSNSGNTCGTKPVTVTGNTFGGSATSVTITENGTGTVNPVSSGTSPFAFTYTPAAADAGKTVLITVTTNNPLSPVCTAASAVYSLTVVNPSAPLVGIITQPTCLVSTGSVVLSGLPAQGTWTLNRSPDGVSSTGSGTSTAIPYLSGGIYTFTVTNSEGCTSSSSGNIVIASQPAIPGAPVVGPITAPACSVPTGSVILSGLPGNGNWILTRYPGTVTSSGSGTSITIKSLPAGTYNFTLTNAAGCISIMSEAVIIPPSPETPSPPVIGTVTQPGSGVPTGSVVLNGLPENDSWTITLTPGNSATSGNGTTTTISGLVPGTYRFTVTNSKGCASDFSDSFAIIEPTGAPLLVINNPPPVCFPSTVDLTDPKITSGSALNLSYNYWTDSAATIQYQTPGAASAGIYFIKGTAADNLYSVKPVTVLVFQIPLANAGPDQILSRFETTMDAALADNYETGIWSVVSGTGEFLDPANRKTPVTGLSKDKNIFLWTVTNEVCPESSDTVMIIVNNLTIPTLITPNMDGKNDYLIIKGSDSTGRIELVIFDRRGVQIYKNEDYDNSWDGIDNKGKPLPEDTYFYILKTDNNKSASGYIVVRR